jgi:hypothetical protein
MVKRLHSVTVSASACEHSWSIQGWLTNKRRNRIGPADALHANLILLDSLETVYFADGERVVCPWDLESEIPEADDDSYQIFAGD